MIFRRRDERGESLVEIVIALVIISLVVTALFTAFTTGSNASNGTRNVTTADAVLRNAAEATKTAVRADCINGGATYSVTFTAPAGYEVLTDITNQPCPPRTGSSAAQAPPVPLTVEAPNGAHKSMTIAVRSP